MFRPCFFTRQVLGYDEEAHLRMQLVICKVRRCQALMQQYLLDIGSSARLLYTGEGHLLLGNASEARMSALLMWPAVYCLIRVWPSFVVALVSCLPVKALFYAGWVM